MFAISAWSNLKVFVEITSDSRHSERSSSWIRNSRNALYLFVLKMHVNIYLRRFGSIEAGNTILLSPFWNGLRRAATEAALQSQNSALLDLSAHSLRSSSPRPGAMSIFVGCRISRQLGARDYCIIIYQSIRYSILFVETAKLWAISRNVTQII